MKQERLLPGLRYEGAPTSEQSDLPPRRVEPMTVAIPRGVVPRAVVPRPAVPRRPVPEIAWPTEAIPEVDLETRPFYMQQTRILAHRGPGARETR